MHWRYRVLRSKANVDRYGVHEVYHLEDGEISWTKDPVHPAGDTPEELREELNMMLAALDEPVLEERGDRIADRCPSRTSEWRHRGKRKP